MHIREFEIAAAQRVKTENQPPEGSSMKRGIMGSLEFSSEQDE